MSFIYFICFIPSILFAAPGSCSQFASQSCSNTNQAVNSALNGADLASCCADRAACSTLIATSWYLSDYCTNATGTPQPANLCAGVVCGGDDLSTCCLVPTEEPSK